MKKIIAMMLLIITCMTGCSNEHEYTPEDAVKHHNLAIVYEEDEIYVYGGEEYWREFITKASSGKRAILQVHSFIEGECEIIQLSYMNGKYYYYTEPEEPYGLCTSFVEQSEYKYLRKLVGYTTMSHKKAEFYVLTDSLELTYDDVFHSLISSDLRTVTDIDFEILWFAEYAENALDEPTIF